jgi:D-serine deaminase-like pyridoxal phosphate-dependent protein
LDLDTPALLLDHQQLQGITVHVLVDLLETARLLQHVAAQFSSLFFSPLPVLIEIDSDGTRAGI